MFLCGSCHKEDEKYGCPGHLFKSRGKCETCGKSADCVNCRFYKKYFRGPKENRKLARKLKPVSLEDGGNALKSLAIYLAALHHVSEEEAMRRINTMLSQILRQMKYTKRKETKQRRGR